MQFARVAHATDFLYCYSIIEANRRMDHGSNSARNGSKTAMTPSHSTFISPIMLGQMMHSELNTFFPFDPYRLPRSSCYIQGVYREWSSVAIDDNDEEEDEEEEVDGDDASVGNHEVETDTPLLEGAIPVSTPHLTTRNSETDGLGASLGGMSISPARPSLSIPSSVPMSVS
jgi:RNA polymerase I-specific transcription initiation factor RRN3